MRNEASNIWFDVTELLRWHGSVTGLQRVNLSYVQNAIRLEPGVRLIRYDGSQDAFEEVPLADFAALFNETRRGAPAPAKARARATMIATGKKLLPETLYRVGAFSLLGTMGFVRRSGILIRRLKHGRPPVPFGPRDQLVLLGNIWGRTGLFEALDRLPGGSRPRIVTMVCDVIPVMRPDFFEPAFARRFAKETLRVLRVSDRVLTISEFSRADIRGLAGKLALSKDVTSCRLGDDPGVAGEGRPVGGLSKDGFILCVGTLEIRKNHRTLLEAWKRLEESSAKLVLVGREGWLVGDLVSALAGGEFGPDVVWLKNASDAELRWLYENCLFSVYPSLYEGWGLPVAESAFYGAFCLSSRASSMPEIAGDLVDYFDPASVADCEAKLHALLGNRAVLEEKRHRLKREYHAVSWERATVDLLKKLTCVDL